MSKTALILMAVSSLTLSAASFADDPAANDASNAASNAQNEASNAAGTVSKDTSSKMDHMKGELQAKLKDACKSDIDQYCKDITPGQGRIPACLKAHDDKLSSGCSKEWQAAREQMKQHWKAHQGGGAPTGSG